MYNWWRGPLCATLVPLLSDALRWEDNSTIPEKVSSIPIPSMHGIFTYIWLCFMVNVGKYTTHGSYGINITSPKLHPPEFFWEFQEFFQSRNLRWRFQTSDHFFKLRNATLSMVVSIVPLIGGRWYVRIITQLAIYTTFILPFGLLGEPGITILPLNAQIGNIYHLYIAFWAIRGTRNNHCFYLPLKAHIMNTREISKLNKSNDKHGKNPPWNWHFRPWK